jgi:glycosyltransferase involved in cell wall biosynthesis
MSGWNDPLLRRLARLGWRGMINLRAMATLSVAGGGGAPRVWYGGARPGNAGGPALKLRKLEAVWPEHIRGYNLVYLQSAAPYLSAGSLAALSRKNVPLVLNQNGVYYPAWFAGDWRASNRPMAILHGMADHVFYQSAFCQRAAQRFLGERSGSAEILYNAIDTKAFAPAPQAPPKPFLFLVTGKIDAHQSYRLTQAIEGLAVARQGGLEAGLLAAGVIAPEAKAQAQAAAARLGLSHAFLLMGSYTQAEAPALYRQAHAYLTLTHQDACPSAVIEAMASGLPVIHPESGGVPELTGETGVAIAAGEDWEKPIIPSADEIGRAMLLAAERRETLSRQARARAVERFEIADWLARHAALFNELLARHV